MVRITSFKCISHFYFSDGNVRSCILGRECNVYNNCSGKGKSGIFGTGIFYVFQSDSFTFHDRTFSTGFLVEAIGINHAFIVLGVLTAVVGGLSFMIPALIALDKKIIKHWKQTIYKYETTNYHQYIFHSLV